MARTHLLVAAAAVLGALPYLCVCTTAKPLPHIITLLVDDLGFYDSQVHNPDSFMTPNLGELAKTGVVLLRHHTYLFCSPTRRSFLSGRFPVHIGANQAGVCSNSLPLGAKLISDKLKGAGYATHMVGKGHLGYETTDHLPVNRGFDTHIGYLECCNSYGMKANSTDVRDMWHDAGPAAGAEMLYSANFYTDHARALIAARNASSPPFYLHLTYQNVHEPFESTPYTQDQMPRGSGKPWWSQVWGDMLSAVDKGVGNVTQALKAAGMYDNTLIVMSSDNGGDCGYGLDDGTYIERAPANNYPLLGRKCTPWDGGTRTAAMVSGGFLPATLRGTTNSVLMHVADWYATLCAVAGVDATDLYNGTDGKLHDIDGVNQWPAITGTSPAPMPRPYVPTTSTSILWSAPNGTIYKLITSATRSNRFHANGSQYMDSSNPCLRQDDVTADDARAAHRHFSGQSAVGTETYANYEQMMPGLRVAREALARGVAPPQHEPQAGVPRSSPGCPRNYTGNCTAACFHPGLCQERANMLQEVRGVTDPAACCAACKANPACVAWNTNKPRKICRLLSDWAPNPGGDCVSGGLRVPGPAPPAPPAPSSNCLVCSKTKPCLFDTSADPGETANIAASHPDLVARLQAQLATYSLYTLGLVPFADYEAQGFTCSHNTSAQPGPYGRWNTEYGPYQGPCCTRT